MITNLAAWLRTRWSPTNRREVMRDYMALREHKLFLADLGLRAGVWSSCHVPGDPYSSAVAEGRRQLALEIIKLAGEEPASLWRYLERNEKD